MNVSQAQQERQGQVTDQVKRLNASVLGLFDELDRLEKTLAPVLNSIPSGISKGNEQPYVVPLAVDLRDLSDRVLLATTRLAEIIERCEL